MPGFGVWIYAVWILFFSLFHVSLSNYSEDQCSWRGRQVFHIWSVVCVWVCVHWAWWKRGFKNARSETLTGASCSCGRCLSECDKSRLVTAVQFKCLRGSAAIAPLGCLREALRVRRAGDWKIKSHAWRKYTLHVQLLEAALYYRHVFQFSVFNIYIYIFT